MYYKMRILPVIFLFSMMTKAQDKVVLGFLIHGVNLILNKGMTGIWIARRYWLFFYIEEPIYPSVYHVFCGGQDYFLQSSFFIASSYSFSTILEFLFDDKFDTGYLSASLNWLKFNIYIGQFIDFCLCFF